MLLAGRLAESVPVRRGGAGPENHRPGDPQG